MSRRPRSIVAILVLVAAVGGLPVLEPTTVAARQRASGPDATRPAGLAELVDGLRFRAIGPATMSGRIDDFAVLETNPSTFYVATATGGLWKTTNNGVTWEVQFDDQEVVSIGDVATPPDDPNLVWVGTGENNNRQSSSWGNGVYKSTDGGRTWKHMGLADTKHIARIVIDPVDRDVVYVAALGHLWGPNRERGVFKTTDGGLTWTNVLFVDEDTGATELVMDPSNNKVLYAATYQRRRAAWGFNGGGPGSAIYKSTDAGRTWTKLTRGLPEGPLGRIGLDIYRRNPSILYARVEHERESGIYRSDDAGATWRRVSTLNPRPMYFSQIRVDPNNPNKIFVLGVNLHISEDGGRTFDTNSSMHADHHAMWIDPANSNHVLTGSDGGVGISWDGGRTWDYIDNMDLGQFYHVGFDMETPYRVYGGLQDNNAWGGPSAVRSRRGIANSDWFIIGGGDGFVAIADPSDSRILYTESQDGRMNRVDRVTNERKVIRPEPARGEPPLRWNWNTPLAVSHHDPATVFVASNRLHKSTDRGHSWRAISPDLTAGIDREQLSLMGVAAKDFRIAKHDGVAAYGTLTAFTESPRRRGLYSTGADDGTVHVSRDDGATWTNLTGRFPGLPKHAYVSRLAASRFEEGTVYATFDNHRSDDYTPYVYVSTDYGQSWRSIASNLPKGHTVHCLTEDLVNPDVLYVGTEFGLFVSIDRGGSWTRIRANLPTVPIYEITLHPRENDMLLATHGRSIWILDDLSPIQRAAEALAETAYLFPIEPAVAFNPANDRTDVGDRRFWGENPQFGARIAYFLRRDAREVALAVRDASGAVVRELGADDLRGRGRAGLHTVAWDLRHQPLPRPRGPQPPQGQQPAQPQEETAPPAGFGGGGLNGPFVLPGEYQVTLVVDGRAAGTRTVRVAGDPDIQITDADRRTHHDTALALHEMQRTAGEAADAVTALGEQLRALRELVSRSAESPAAVKAALDDVDRRLAGLRRRLGVGGPGPGGGGGGFGGFGGGQANVRGRLGQLKNQIMASTSLPTETQMRQAREAREDLAKAIEEANELITSGMPALYRTVTQNQLQPTPLKPIRALVALTTSNP